MTNQEENNPQKFVLEACVDSVESAIAAQEGGADRVELCAALDQGGLTPSASAIELCSSLLHIGLHVIIRPRGGDFFYSELEFEQMKREVQLAVDLGDLIAALDINPLIVLPRGQGVRAVDALVEVES